MTNLVGIFLITAYVVTSHADHHGHRWEVGATCAASRRFPLGTVLLIEGIGKRIVTDRLHIRFDADRVDLPFETGREDALRWGARKRKVCVVKIK